MTVNVQRTFIHEVEVEVPDEIAKHAFSQDLTERQIFRDYVIDASKVPDEATVADLEWFDTTATNCDAGEEDDPELFSVSY